MTEERKADVDARLAELEHELFLAIKQRLIEESFQWKAAIDMGPDKDPWIALLSVARVGERT
jgi:hypothetical protein